MIELMITLSIAAVLVSLALPSFQGLLGESKISATTNNFVYSLQSARSEAIKRAAPVALCHSSNSMAAEPSCSGNSFADGWIVFADSNGDGQRSAAEDLLYQAEARPTGFKFTPDTAFAERVYFGGTGSSTNTAGIPLSGRIRISFNPDSDSRDIVISANGRISSEVVE